MRPLYGDGIQGAHGGSMLSSIGGTIRLGELRPNSGPMRHALKINIYGAKNFYKCRKKEECNRWPAPASDGYAFSVEVGPDGDFRHQFK